MKPSDLDVILSTTVPAYWFGDVDDKTTLTMSHEAVRRWNAKSSEVDEHIRTNFLPVYRDLVGKVEQGWKPPSLTQRLGAVLVLDQFPRHIYRDQPAMYATDEIACQMTRDALATHEHESLSLARRMFLYMPLMHTEVIKDQQQVVALFDQLLKDSRTRSPQSVPFFEMSCGYARRHLEIVERFGRFPHRNTILGRTSSDAEVAFLKEPNSSF
jgi:uncharacterized protein (DUF924 family)